MKKDRANIIIVLLLIIIGLLLIIIFKPIFTGKIINGLNNDSPKLADNNRCPIIPTQEYAKVTRVIDGDTVEFENGERVRLICIDTPERGEEGYLEAKEFVEDLILNKEVKLQRDCNERDKYQRLLRYIFIKDKFVNKEVVLQGYGKSYPYSNDIRLCPEIIKAEEFAKNNCLGVWKNSKECTGYVSNNKNNINNKIDYNKTEYNKTKENEQEADYDCSSNIYNCADFKTQIEAQRAYDFCVKNIGKDIHRLDQDSDGVACEGLR
ncbi:MAG: thermonuclease family protein [Nanoarchaeota archaeon]|nr:thermonuclease family protein [Nanoarchaeota archaeon]